MPLVSNRSVPRVPYDARHPHAVDERRQIPRVAQRRDRALGVLDGHDCAPLCRLATPKLRTACQAPPRRAPPALPRRPGRGNAALTAPRREARCSRAGSPSECPFEQRSPARQPPASSRQSPVFCPLSALSWRSSTSPRSPEAMARRSSARQRLVEVVLGHHAPGGRRASRPPATSSSSPVVRNGGFSTMTCLPAARARSVHSM